MLPIWKRQAKHVLFYEQAMYDEWVDLQRPATANNPMPYKAAAAQLYATWKAYWETDCRSENGRNLVRDASFARFYCMMQEMLANLAKNICTERNSLSYYNYVEQQFARCAVVYLSDEKRSEVEWSIVPPRCTTAMFWRTKRNSISHVAKRTRILVNTRMNTFIPPMPT